jgi:D-arabinose 1-dehydrogenase-like Zn-dependent alcohol dehydrogenase
MVCHNTKHDGVLKKLAASLDLIISTINVPLDIPGLLDTLAPNGKLHVVEAILEPMQMPAFGLIMRQKSIAGSPTGHMTSLQSFSFSSSFQSFLCKMIRHLRGLVSRIISEQRKTH